MIEVLKKVGNYRLIRRIGQGATAEVYEARKEGSSQKYAIKMIKMHGLKIKERQMIVKEISIIKSISHPNIVKLYENLQTSNNYYLVFEYCQKGDLQHYLKSHDSPLLPEQTAQRIIFNLADAIALIHSKNIVHRDIKLSNVLLTKDFQIKLADFGFAKEVDESFLMQTYCGTPITMAPEILQGKPYDKKCDIWSLGVILFQIVFGKLPFSIAKGFNSFVDLVTTQQLEIPSLPQTPPEFKQLLCGALQKKPQNRYSIETFLTNPWVQEGNMNLEKVNKKIQTVGELLRNVSNEYKDITEEEKLTKIISQEGEQKKQRFHNQKLQYLVSLRLYQTITDEINKICFKYQQIRASIIKSLSSPLFNKIGSHQLLNNLLYFLDYSYLQHFIRTPILIVCNQTDEVKYDLQNIHNVEFPKRLATEEPANLECTNTLFKFLSNTIKSINLELQEKKKIYEIVIEFLQLFRRFNLKAQVLFSVHHYQNIQTDKIMQHIKKGIFQNVEELMEGNHITIAVECREKDQKMKEMRDIVKANCLKRINQIEKQLNGFT